MGGFDGLFNGFSKGRIDRPDENGETKLMHAVRDGNVGRVRLLLRRGANPSIANVKGLSPLHIAAYWGEVQILDALLKFNAKVNADNGKGWTPLHSAALAGGMKTRSKIIGMLRRAGAREDILDKNGWTAGDYMKLWEKDAEAAAKMQSVVPHEYPSAAGRSAMPPPSLPPAPAP